MKKTCETCKFGHWKDRGTFVCRQTPHFEHHQITDWCGQWKAVVEENATTEDELIDMVFELFTEGTYFADGKWDHHCISTYEDAQALLIKHGRIKKEDCYRD